MFLDSKNIPPCISITHISWTSTRCCIWPNPPWKASLFPAVGLHWCFTFKYLPTVSGFCFPNHCLQSHVEVCLDSCCRLQIQRLFKLLNQASECIECGGEFPHFLVFPCSLKLCPPWESCAMSAEYLAEKLGCDLPLAAAALKVCHDAETAASVIQDGQANPLDPYAEGLEPGPSHGDAVFRHPYVQCLLAVARQRVNQALEESCETGQWLICVRTFQRPGLRCQQSELHRFLQGVLEPKAATILENKLEAVNIDWPTLQKMAKKPLHAFEEAMRRAGVLRFSTKTAKKLAAKVREPLEKIEKKQHSSEKGLRELTLAALELALGPDAYKRCLIFVSHTDHAWISGQYAAALRGTPWADRIVVGIRGAQLQAIKFERKRFKTWKSKTFMTFRSFTWTVGVPVLRS